MSADVEKIRGWVKDIIYVIVLVVSIVLAYGMLDKRMTVVETEQRYKISRQELYNKLDELKDDLLEEIRRVNKK